MIKTIFADIGAISLLLLFVVGCGWLGAYLEDLAEKMEEKEK